MNKLSKIIKLIISQISFKKVTANILTLAPNEYLKNKTALITGGTSGIGLAIASSFVKSGASVIITGRDEIKADIAIKSLKQLNKFGNINYIIIDNSDVTSLEEKIPECLKKIGPIDILVNNAGIMSETWSNSTKEDYDLVMNTNLRGTFFLSKIIAKHMIENKIHGRILNICSSSSMRPANSAYALSKWGLRGLTVGMAKTLIKHNIIVNGIAPGPTATPMLMKGGKQNRIDNKNNPLGRMAMPEEIANMAVFLASDFGSTIVGDIVNMSGGAGIITYDDIKYDFNL